MGTPSEQVQDDGKVSFEEFKLLATKGDELHLKTSALWASVRQVKGVVIVIVCVCLCRMVYCKCQQYCAHDVNDSTQGTATLVL